MAKRRFNRRKLDELILHICRVSGDDPSFDNAKLIWLLFAADFESYRQTGRSITGTTYVKTAEYPFLDMALPRPRKRANA